MKDKIKKAVKENIIGKIIYGFLLFAPLLSILFTSLYTTFNKNAYQSYSSNQVQQLAQIDNINNLLENETYYLQPDITAGTSNKLTYQYNYTSINIDWRNYGANDREYIGFRLLKSANTDTNYKVWAYYTESDFQQLTINNADMPKDIIFTLSSVITTNGTLLGGEIYSYIYRTQTLDNSFEHGIEKVEQSNYYNWAKTTGTYNVLVATCNGLGITNTFTPMLLSYWMIITIIYLVYDIALVFVLMVHRKIHELQESI